MGFLGMRDKTFYFLRDTGMATKFRGIRDSNRVSIIRETGLGKKLCGMQMIFSLHTGSIHPHYGPLLMVKKFQRVLRNH